MKRIEKGFGLFYDVLEFIKANGPCTVRDIYAGVDYPENSVRVAVSALKKEYKCIYIKKWVRENDTFCNRALASYAVGDAPDAKKPRPLPRSAYAQRHRERKRLLVNSVFALGKCVDDIRVTTRKRPDVAKRHQEKAAVA